MPAEIFIHQNEMMAVAADKKVPIRDVNDYYRARHKRIAAQLNELGIDDRNPHPDLWHFYKKWSASRHPHALSRLIPAPIRRRWIDPYATDPPDGRMQGEPVGLATQHLAARLGDRETIAERTFRIEH